MKKNVFLSLAAISAIAAIATGLGLPAFSQPIPEDSASMFRRQQGKPPLPPSSGTTGIYTPRQEDKPTPSSSYQPWTLSFQGQEKCLFVAFLDGRHDISLCARITADGSGNAELYQPAGRMGGDMYPSGWFESTFPQYAKQWPNWSGTPGTEASAYKPIVFFDYDPVQKCNRGGCENINGGYSSIEPIFDASGKLSDWRFSYLRQTCLQPELDRWVTGCTLPYP
jgi:hypothetical protein